MTDNAPFIRNAWYVAAWDHELLPDGMLARTLLGEPMVLWRRDDGTVVAMHDLCPHRHAPLSLGRREGDSIRCLYHGMRFDGAGQCVEVPGQQRLPAKACVRIQPSVERKRWIWVWMGDPALADESLVPDTFSLASPQWRMKPGYKHFNAAWLLITDNLLDFSHLSFVHEKTFGGSTTIAQVAPQVTELEHGIRVFRRVDDTVPAPYHQRLGQFEGKVNRWFDYTLTYTGLFMMEAVVQPVGRADGDLEGALRFHTCQALTPESATSTHYFFAQAHAFALDDATVTEAVFQSVATAFDEDLRMLEAQQKNILAHPGAPMVPIGADGALTRYRRRVATALQAEQPGHQA
ncbi:MAG: aromatic ring-hydroxylating dioxygenase subunit alpha [Burkholderiaceae bacterium]